MFVMNHTNEATVASNDSNDNIKSLSKIQYGPISVRVCRKNVPTLETGRRSKNLVLVGDEAAKREARRQRNREAARKLKEKRKQIEDELYKKLEELESQHAYLQNHLQNLNQQKEILQTEINELLAESMNDLLSNDEYDIQVFIEQYSNDVDLLNGSIDRILDSDFDFDFSSVT